MEKYPINSLALLDGPYYNIKGTILVKIQRYIDSDVAQVLHIEHNYTWRVLIKNLFTF